MKLVSIDKSEIHYDTCKQWLENRDITKWLTSPLRFPKYFKTTHEMLLNNRKNKLYFIDFKGAFVGIVAFSNIDLVDKRAELWYLIGSRSDRNKNVATRAVGLIKRQAADQIRLISLFAHVAESNVPSIQVLKKSGFEYVGKFRKAFCLDGTYEDLLIFDWLSDIKTASQ